MVKEKYVSPLEDELGLDLKNFGSGILLHLNKKTKRVLLDIPVGIRNKISSSGNSMLLANGKYDFDELKGQVQMNVNVWDKIFTPEELPKVKEFLSVKKQQADYKKQLADLQKA